MNSSLRVVRLVSGLVMALVVLTPVLAGAQTPGAQTPGAQAPADHQQIISANPFGLMFEWFNVEYQRRMTPSTTWGVSMSWFAHDADDFDYASGGGLIRYYPSETAMRGFYIGGRGGVYRVSDGIDSGVYFGAGFEIGYDWLLGKKQNIGLSLGVGATRLFGDGLDGAATTIPTLRLLNLGIAF